jgi:catechol 2,3-dioxygenase-like lactoylglutathione lyase family enzyme
MGFHHLAIATRDVKANHEFYTGPMGFELVKTVVGRSGRAGWAKHLFYDTGNGELIAFWDLHDPDIPDDWSSAIADGLGLPRWTNHIAFHAQDLDDIATRRQRWLDHGLEVTEIDHGWCTSIYTNDPNQILVEWCTSTEEFTEADRAEALRLLADPEPEPEGPPKITHHRPGDTR